MVNQPSPLEELIGVSAPRPMPGDDFSVAPPMSQGGLSLEAASLLTGGPPSAPAQAGEEAQMGGPPSPMSDPVPPQNPAIATGPAVPSAGAPGAAPAPVGVPDINDPDMEKDFWARHGRAPTSLDKMVMHAIPALERTLGRAPMRIEVLQFLGARQETPIGGKAQFEPDTPGSGALPSGPGISAASFALGEAPLQPESMAQAQTNPVKPPAPTGGM